MTTYFVDGVSLDSGGWNLLKGTSLPASAARRVATLELHTRSGVTTSHGGWGLGIVKVSLVVLGEGVLGAVGSVESRLGALQSLLARARVLRRESPGLPDMEVHVIEVQVSEPTQFGVHWRVDATFTVGPFWSEPNLVTSASKTPPGSMLFAEWAGTTGDVMDGILRVRGPLTRFNVTALDGSGASFEHALTDSQYAFVDVESFTAWRGSASAWAPTSNTILLDYPAAGPLRLTPGADGVALSVSGEGFDSETSGVVLRGRKWWL